MDSPADGDELARVVPLRRRDPELGASPGARGTLPRERAPFDPEIEPVDTPSGHRPPRGTALRVARSALRSRRAPQPRHQAASTTARRASPALLLTGAGVAGLATIAVLALLGSLLTASPQSPATHVESLGGRGSTGALELTTPGVLSASADPFAATGAPAAGKTAHTLTRQARSKSTRSRSRRTRSATRTPRSKGTAVVASYTPGTSGTTSRGSSPDTQAAAVTNSTSAVQTSTAQQSATPTRASSASASTANRPAFGEQGLLGPGSSPDS